MDMHRVVVLREVGNYKTSWDYRVYTNFMYIDYQKCVSIYPHGIRSQTAPDNMVMSTFS